MKEGLAHDVSPAGTHVFAGRELRFLAGCDAVAGEGLAMRHFDQMYDLELRCYGEEFITPAAEAYDWYLAFPNTTVAALDGDLVVGFVNMFPVVDDVFRGLKEGTFNDADLTTEGVLDLDRWSSGRPAGSGSPQGPLDPQGPRDPLHMFLSCIAMEPAFRGTGLSSELLRVAALQYAEYSDYVDQIVADAVTEDGERFMRRHGFAFLGDSDHGSKVFLQAYADFERLVMGDRQEGRREARQEGCREGRREGRQEGRQEEPQEGRMLEFRPATLDDYDGVIALYDAAIRKMIGTPLDIDWRWEFHPTPERLRNDIVSGTMLLALEGRKGGESGEGGEGGEICGALVLNYEGPEEYRTSAWPSGVPAQSAPIVHLLAVDPAKPRRGIGRGIMEYAIQTARDRGDGAVRLDVFPYNEPAIRLYEGLGFVDINQFIPYGTEDHANLELYELAL